MKKNANQLCLFDLPPEPGPEKMKPINITSFIKNPQEKKETKAYINPPEPEPLEIILKELNKIEKAIKDNISLIWDINTDTGKDYYFAVTELKILLETYTKEATKEGNLIKITCQGNILNKMLYSIFRKPLDLLTRKNIKELQFFKSNLKFYPEPETMSEVLKSLGNSPYQKILTDKKVIVYFNVEGIKC